MAEIVRTQEEIDDVLNESFQALETGRSRYPGMTYEQGIEDMYHWLVGDSDDPLFD